jgi:hypothetical protein
MRRGSKSPSMLVGLLSLNFEKEVMGDSQEVGAVYKRQLRRLSIVSSLRLAFESSSMIETKVARQIRRLSFDQTLELISKV